MKNSTALVLVAFCLVAACGGEAKLGEECGESGRVDGECEDGAVCGKQSDTTEDLFCIKQCTDDAQCGVGGACNGVSGTSIKGCRAKAK